MSFYSSCACFSESSFKRVRKQIICTQGSEALVLWCCAIQSCCQRFLTSENNSNKQTKKKAADPGDSHTHFGFVFWRGGSGGFLCVCCLIYVIFFPSERIFQSSPDPGNFKAQCPLGNTPWLPIQAMLWEAPNSCSAVLLSRSGWP